MSLTPSTLPLSFRDPAQAQALTTRLAELVARSDRPLAVMHVCGSHEQAIARYGLRSRLPAGLEVLMGPGCPVCVTDAPEVDEAVALATSGLHILTYGDMMRVPGSTLSLDEVRAQGAKVTVIYAATQAVEVAHQHPDSPIVFFATGFETTAVATAAILANTANPPPDNLFVLSAHKWVPAAMEVVASLPDSRIDGYLAAGHAATITGSEIFEPFVQRYGRPVVIAGFEPLDILAALVVLVEQLIRHQQVLVNAFPRCVSRAGNTRAMALLNRVFEMGDGDWRGIARVPNGNLRLRPEYARYDASLHFQTHLASPTTHPSLSSTPSTATIPPELLALRQDTSACLCGKIMTGAATPSDCRLFGTRCRPEHPVGACMVSTEGACRIWLEHDLARPA
jgi:hydrogenase expression/formation protein HypD